MNFDELKNKFGGRPGDPTLKAKNIISAGFAAMGMQKQLAAAAVKLAATEAKLTKADSKKRKRGDKIARAMAYKQRNPGWSLTEVAAAAGCQPSTLSRSPEYEAFAAKVEGGRAAAIGHRPQKGKFLIVASRDA